MSCPECILYPTTSRHKCPERYRPDEEFRHIITHYEHGTLTTFGGWLLYRDLTSLTFRNDMGQKRTVAQDAIVSIEMAFVGGKFE